MAGAFRLLLLLLLATAPAFAAPLKNALAGHASPYLALHGRDPVAWQEWNAETVARARRENKLLFVSLGYFSCHWCHVMQKESYRDPAIAALLNRYFIPVKVDRELNGALDSALLEFAERLNGVSGWPLNAFVTPEGFPAYAVLYLPPGDFKTLLTRMAAAWKARGDDFRQAAREAAPPPEPARLQAPGAGTAKELERAYLEAVWRSADTLQGGFSRVSKFPMAPHLARLLEIYARDRDPRLGGFLQLTLDQMARRGLRDHVNGGFFRYTVDPDWHTPHFEKMLADNAQLAPVYARAAELFQRPDYRAVAHEALDFLLEALAAPGGGYYTAASALDRRGREGGVYLWSKAELRQRLSPEEYGLAARAWNLEAAATSPLGHLPLEHTDLAPAERARLQTALKKLKAAGRQRQAPLDTKINAGLNGLALSAFVAAGRGEARFEGAARDLAAFLSSSMTNQGRLLKTRAGGRVFAEAELDDYAYVVAGLLDYAAAHRDAAAGRLARQLVSQAWRRFFTPEGWRREETPLLATARPEAALADGALPSASARLMAASRELLRRQPEFGLSASLERAIALAVPALAGEPFEHPSGLDSLSTR
ncbi:MAG TPA: DUF255 domain-containing protein [Thiobacillaceae bacterium]|nr:DUF255 domain-containing protein [Thiobacillaceae bacterium]